MGIEENADQPIDRRKALGRLGTAGAVGASAWAAPSVLGSAAASAAVSDTPTTTPTNPPVCGGDMVVLYAEDFEGANPDLSMWSSNASTPAVAVTPSGRSFLGNNAPPYTSNQQQGAQFNTEIVALDLVAPPGACTMRLSFDLFRIMSWDGTTEDTFQVQIQGGPALVQRTSFNHGRGSVGQAYPDPTPASNAAKTGEDESDTLGYTYFGDGVYRFFPGVADNVSTLEVPIAPGPFRIEFQATLNQTAIDEAWGLDNVSVEVDLVA